MGSISYTIPVAGSTSFSVAASEVDTALQTLLTWANGNVDGANVPPSLTGRRLVAQAAAVFPASTTSGNYFPLGDGSAVKAGSATTKAISWFYLDPANFAVTGKANTQGIVRFSVGASANGNSITFGGQLNAFSLGTTGASLTPSAGAQTGTTALVIPGGGTTGVAESNTFAFPSAGAYCPLINLSGNMGASDIVTVLWQLYVLNT